MKTKSHVRGSLQACLRPSMAVALLAEASLVSELATLSFSIREWARVLSRPESQFVVRGVLGRSQKPRMATMAVATPSRMKSLK